MCIRDRLLITTALLFALHMNGTLTTFVTLPGLGYVDLGLLYYPLSYGLIIGIVNAVNLTCLLYTSDAADDLLCVDLGGRRSITKKKKRKPSTA